MTHREIEDGMGFGGLVESNEERQQRQAEESKLGDRLGPRLAIGSAIEEVIGSLPVGCELQITITYQSANVVMWFVDGDSASFRRDPSHLSDAIRDALLYAIKKCPNERSPL